VSEARHPFVLLRMRTAEHEAAAPKYAHLELERRWLVGAATADGLEACDPIAIHDRYIVGTRMRLREMRHGGATVYKLTKKYDCADALVRPIVTAYLKEAEYSVFAVLPALTLRKRRFRVSSEGRNFTLDRFEGPLAGLTLAEIEVASEADLRALAQPAWTVREVSDDPRYQGAALARDGIPTE
jgi:CYTH domain-containing protein